MPEIDSVEVKIISTQNMPIFLPKSTDTDVNLICTVTLKSEVNIPVNVQTEWSRVGSSFQSYSTVHMDILTSYSSMITIRSINVSDAGNYTCRSTVSMTSRRYITGERKNEETTSLSLCKLFRPYQTLTAIFFQFHRRYHRNKINIW